MTIVLSSIVTQSNEPVFTEIDGETVMMSIENGNYYGLNDLGSRIWQLLETPISITSLCEILLGEYEVDQATIERDVLMFLTGMEAKNLIKVCS